MAEFRFTNEHTSSEVGNVISVLQQPRLWIPTETDYPAHAAWLDKVEAQVQSGKKRTMLAYIGCNPVGGVVYQRHEDRPHTVEVRNISVAPNVKGRYMGSFLLRNTEIEAVGNDYPDADNIMVDTKVTNTGMVNFLETHGYVLDNITDLYASGTDDAVFVKPLVAEVS